MVICSLFKRLNCILNVRSLNYLHTLTHTQHKIGKLLAFYTIDFAHVLGFGFENCTPELEQLGTEKYSTLMQCTQQET